MLIQRTGLTFHDKARATPGFTLFSGIFSDRVRLIDIDGKVVHEWETTGGSTNFNYLLPNGNLFVCERVDGGPKLVSGKSGRMREYDWDGHVVWEHVDDHQHHDARRLENGGAVYIAWKLFSDDEARQARGGIPGTEIDGDKMYGEVIREIDESGNVVFEFFNNAPEFLDRYEIAPLKTREEYGHANTVAVLPSGDYLVSYRVFNLLAIVDRQTGGLKWEFQDHALGGQHDCQMLDNGNILVFANGHNSPGGKPNFSQVWELELETKEIVWRYYPTKNPLTFWSPHISGCQRLESGNTLICEGGQGCIFEVTSDGEVVWEYINPSFVPHPTLPGCEHNWVFRAKRYAADSAEIRNRV